MEYKYHVFNPTIIGGHIGLFYNLNIETHAKSMVSCKEACKNVDYEDCVFNILI